MLLCYGELRNLISNTIFKTRKRYDENLLNEFHNSFYKYRAKYQEDFL